MFISLDDFFSSQCLTSWFCQKILEFLILLAKILAVIFGREARFCQIFQDCGNECKEIIGVFGRKTKKIQDIGKENNASM